MTGRIFKLTGPNSVANPGPVTPTFATTDHRHERDQADTEPCATCDGEGSVVYEVGGAGDEVPREVTDICLDCDGTGHHTPDDEYECV